MAVDNWAKVVDELSRASVEVTPESLSQLRHAKRIFVAGAGRSGLAIRAFAMRLSQLGLSAAVVGETTTPAFTSADLLIVASGSAETPRIKALVQKAHQIGGRCWLWTATSSAELAATVDTVTLLPGKGKFAHAQAGSVQPMGTLFEQAVWLYGDAIVLTYMQTYDVDESALQARHANLE